MKPQYKNLKMVLLALAKVDIFPMPRFSLGISCIANAVRYNTSCEVKFLDMQIDSADSIRNELMGISYDIVGISVTFGQYLILTDTLNNISNLYNKNGKTIVVGGSLAALNYDAILSEYKNIVVCLGYGEQTMIDIVRYQQGEIGLKDVCNIAYRNKSGIIVTKKADTKEKCKYVPSLDLLEKTLKLNGVMQFETSRGCHNACSFCPREHKGDWESYSFERLTNLIYKTSEVFNNNPTNNKKVFIVDEECIGIKRNNTERIISISDLLLSYNFRYELNSRLDQVYKEGHRNFNLNRVSFWKRLVKQGLDKVLFGIESGVQSILDRFNKKLTINQIEIAIRILSLSGVPVRYTYITFDPLMNMDELVESYIFLSRDDLVLSHINHLPDVDLLKLAESDSNALKGIPGSPLYKYITYMMVSLECLSGSQYTKNTRVNNSIYGYNKSIGKYNILYRDPIIGMISHYCQLWVDRNFTFDYTLKSLVKIRDKCARDAYLSLRHILKEMSHELLGIMLVMALTKGKYDKYLLEKLFMMGHIKCKFNYWDYDNLMWNDAFLKLLEHQFTSAVNLIERTINGLLDVIPENDIEILDYQLNNWKAIKEWRLLNN